jgi:hypothetical protein
MFIKEQYATEMDIKICNIDPDLLRRMRQRFQRQIRKYDAKVRGEETYLDLVEKIHARIAELQHELADLTGLTHEHVIALKYLLSELETLIA